MRPLLIACLAAAAVPAAAANPFQVSQIAMLDNPWGMAVLPDGQALITEKAGNLRLLRTNGQLSGPLPGVPQVAFGGQLGLLDVAVSPGFATNKRIYLSFMEPAGGQSRLALAEARLVNEGLTELVVIWRATPSTTGGHPGGRIAITGTGSIFLTTGERQQFTPAQDPQQTLGKIIRIDRLGQPRPDNPFVANSAYKAEIWTLGHRNPYGLVWDVARSTLWSHEMGPQGGDELNMVVKGRNYGWPVVSEGDNYDGTPIPPHATRPEFAAPVFAWPETAAPSGLVVYRGALFPAWQGSLLAGGLAGQSLYRFKLSGKRIVSRETFPLGARVRDVEQGPDGAIWVLTDGAGGKLLRLTPN
jgi:aldose sugar dehydrogenase